MSQRIWISGRYFECAVDRIARNTDGWVVKTAARRYFRFDGASIGLLRHVMALKALDPDDPAQAPLVAFIGTRLVPLGIYRAVDGDAPARPGVRTSLVSRGVMRWQRQLLSAERVGRLVAAVSRLCSPWLVVAVLAACVPVHVRCIATSLRHLGYRDLVSLSATDLLCLFAFAVVRGLLHELGHAIACWRLTRSVGAIGFGIFIATPVLYCDVSDVHLLPRRQKAIVGLGGTAMDIVVLAALAAFAGASPVAAKLYGLNLLAVLLNLLPFYRNDGYWVVNDLVGRHDVLRESIRACLAGTARAADRAWVAATTACVLVAGAFAAEFALRLGPRQLVDGLHQWPAFAGWSLLAVTAMQYAAVGFAAMSAAKLLARGWRWCGAGVRAVRA